MGNWFCSLLHQAGDSDNIKGLKRRLSRCKHIDLRGKFRSTRLHKAVEKNRSRERTRLFYACAIRCINVDIARNILNHGTDPNIVKKDGIGPLHAACHRGNLELVELLIRHQANVNIQDNSGRTPLHCAVMRLSPEVPSCLLAHGADADLTDGLNMNAFMCLLKEQYWRGELLLSNTPDEDAEREACALRHQYNECNELLLSYTRNLDVVSYDGRTALLLALQLSDLRTVRALLGRGASLTAHTYKHSSLEAAVATGQFEMFELVWRHTDARTVAETKDFMVLVGKHCPFPQHPKHYELVLNTPGVDLHLDGVRGLFARILQPSSDQDKEATKSQVLSVFGGLLDRGVRLGTEDIEQILQCFIRPYTLELWTMIFAKTTPDITQYVVGCAIDHRVYDVALLFATYCLHLSPEKVFRREVPELFCRHWLALFTPTSQDKWAVEDRAQGLMSDRTVQILNETNQVKRLLELSRDAAREAMRGSCRTTQDFLAGLEKLEIPSDLKDIIRLRVPVNRHLLETGVPLDVGSCNGVAELSSNIM